jgi:hypothetical protein
METIMFVMGPEQVQSLMKDLTASLIYKAGSVLLISSNKPDFENQMHQALEAWQSGHIILSGLPDPDIVCHSNVWTIALPTDLEMTLNAIQSWSEGGKES